MKQVMTGAADRKAILVVAVLTSFASTLMLSAVNVALPEMGSDLSMNAIELGWIAQAFALSVAIMALPGGRLADIWGRRKLFTIGLVIATVSTLLAAFSASFAQLVVLRVVQGIGTSLVYSTGVALITTAYSAGERGKVIGINIAAVYLGLTLGPTIGGMLTHFIGWRSIFFLSILLQIPALVLLFSRIKSEWVEGEGERLDWVGCLLWAAVMFAVIYGFSIIPDMPGILMMAAGIVVAGIFIAWESRAPFPIFNIKLVTRNRMFAFSNLSQFLYYCSIFAVPLLLSLYLQYISGFNPQDAGFVLLAQPLLQVFFAPLSGRLSDRIQPRVLVTFGLGIVLAGLVLLLFTISSSSPSLVLIIVSLVLLGLGAAFFISPTTNAIVTSVDRKSYGVAAAIEMTSRNVGMTIGMGIVTFLFSLYIGNAQITAGNSGAFMDSVSIIYAISVGTCFLSILASVFRGKRVLRS